MPTIYELYFESMNGVHSAGAFRTAEAAEARLQELTELQQSSGRSTRYWVKEVDTTGMFEVPSRPAPRERYSTRCTPLGSEPSWKPFLVEVLDVDRVVATYQRNLDMYDTFEPFRQGDRSLALISSDYTATSILDLQTGEILGGEVPHSDGFCPVGFFVPDWWDVWPDWLIPGSSLWRPHYEWPHGDFGFVWGCQWGDDSSWKVQFLDLTRAAEGIIAREERFGYLPLATRPRVPGSEFIRVGRCGDEMSVTFNVPCRFDLSTGQQLDDGGPILGRW